MKLINTKHVFLNVLGKNRNGLRVYFALHIKGSKRIHPAFDTKETIFRLAITQAPKDKIGCLFQLNLFGVHIDTDEM